MTTGRQSMSREITVEKDLRRDLTRAVLAILISGVTRSKTVGLTK